MIIIYSFCWDTEAKKGAMYGNVDDTIALQLLQQMVIEKARQESKDEPPEKSKK